MNGRVLPGMVLLWLGAVLPVGGGAALSLSDGDRGLATALLIAGVLCAGLLLLAGSARRDDGRPWC